MFLSPPLPDVPPYTYAVLSLSLYRSLSFALSMSDSSSTWALSSFSGGKSQLFNGASSTTASCVRRARLRESRKVLFRECCEPSSRTNTQRPASEFRNKLPSCRSSNQIASVTRSVRLIWCSLLHLFVRSFVRLSVRLLIRSLVSSVVWSSLHSFAHSFAC